MITNTFKESTDLIRTFLLVICVLGVVLYPSTNLIAQSSDTSRGSINPDTTTLFGGPSSVGGQLQSDRKQATDFLSGYFDFKDSLQKSIGLQYGIDYNPVIQTASKSLGIQTAASSSFRIYGQWDLVGRPSGNSGSLVFKTENRHKLGTDIPAQGLASEIGYAGLTAVPYNDIGWALSNLYWEQKVLQNKLAFIAGIVDVTDYTNVYGLIDPWNDFFNLTFSTDPTIPVPNQGIGIAARWMITDYWYLLAGISDANGDPTRPFASAGDFFQTPELFTQFELGWVGTFDNRFSQNAHLTYWNASQRVEAQVLNGWGLAFSYNQVIGEDWNPFLRLAYAKDGGAIYEASVSAGTGHKMANGHQLSFGFNWGRPMQSTFGTLVRKNQYTIEAYYRIHILRIFTITPDIQILINPALNPESDVIAVFGARARIRV